MKLPGVLLVAGMVLIGLGTLLWSVPFGLVVSGVLLLVLASMSARGV